KKNTEIEMARNHERYVFLRWGQQAFDNFSVVPPGTGICHQVNLEYIAKVAYISKENVVYPDTLVGTDSHTTMVNGLGVLGWGVGGIEAEAAMLGQPVSMLIPQVVGFKLRGKLEPGATATDLVLTVTQMLRKKGVVDKFVEFYGPGLDALSVADRATISNMAPEYGATCGFFPVDAETIAYLRFTHRSPEQVDVAEAYLKQQGLFRTKDTPDPVFTDSLELRLEDVVPSIAGPTRPQDRIVLSEAKIVIGDAMADFLKPSKTGAKATDPAAKVAITRDGMGFELTHGSVVLAAITSCTNTSNPSVMLGAGLLAKKAIEKGLRVKPWVKTSLAPGSKVVTEYLNEAGLTPFLEGLGFHLVGYGCTTCIGNSGPLPDDVTVAIKKGDLTVAAVLSGNRNFEGRISPHVRMNFLASPPLVVAYALAGRVIIDFETDVIGYSADGDAVYLKDIWPTPDEVNEAVRTAVKPEHFAQQYAHVFDGEPEWQSIAVPPGNFYAWDKDSTYVQLPPFFQNIAPEPTAKTDITAARALAVLGDSITTDHISPAGDIAKNGPAAKYLTEHGVAPRDFNSYGARRGNHEVMMRGTFANVRLKNLLVPGTEGGVTVHIPSGEQMAIFDASMRYQREGTPLVVLAGAEYGTGSSRDWAAKGTQLLGVKAVIAKSFERIHRSNLIGMGVVPLQFKVGEDVTTHGLTGKETFEISGLASDVKPGKMLTVKATSEAGKVTEFEVRARLDTPNEVDYWKHGGILVYVLRQMLKGDKKAA
ncbi:MAG: aconitate hydratase AcnA, partial [Clostridia bacterium]|nr:aconitate hydratase AcnA [Deltaproteobacteria bacterium]